MPELFLGSGPLQQIMKERIVTNNEASDQEHPQIPVELGYGSPTPEQEMPGGAAATSGSPDPAPPKKGRDKEAVGEGNSLGEPERQLSENEVASRGGETTAARLDGKDNRPREELSHSDSDAASAGPKDETPPEAPSTEAPLEEGNAGPTSSQRESFSSESDDDASGAPA